MGNVIGAARLDRRKLPSSCKPPLHVIWAAAWGTGSDASRPQTAEPVAAELQWLDITCSSKLLPHGKCHPWPPSLPYHYPVPERTLEMASSCRNGKPTGACPHCLRSSGNELSCWCASLPVRPRIPASVPPNPAGCLSKRKTQEPENSISVSCG